tara:strand:+ start:33877 stop:34140 length:264 start_codon:yes stop_codon:yes gene_type:complete
MAAAKKEPKLKLRTTYPAGMVNEAKAQGLGVITVSIQFPNGDREERQMEGTALECRFARWAGVLLSEPRVKPLVDLEEIVRDALESP